MNSKYYGDDMDREATTDATNDIQMLNSRNNNFASSAFPTIDMKELGQKPYHPSAGGFMRQKSRWEKAFEELARLDGDDDPQSIQISKLKRFLRQKSSTEVS